MAVNDQWKTIKNNWLIVLGILIVVGLLYFNAGEAIGGYLPSSFGGAVRESAQMMKSDVLMSYPSVNNFAPAVQDRKITKTANLNTEVVRGTFLEAEHTLKNLLSGHSFLLNENVNKYDVGRKSYNSGSYTIKVDVRQYDEMIAALKQIGEVQSFSENAQDITGSYADTQMELSVEKARLVRYQQMLQEATAISDKIELSDRIFNQERTIKYLEDSFKNQDQQVHYATIYLQISEKRSEFADTVVVSVGQLVQSLVESVNNLLQLIFVVLPWVVVVGIMWLGVRWVRRRK